MNRFPALLLLSTAAFAQTDWPSYGNDPGAMRYSSLRQIHARNVGGLKLAWTFRTGKPGSEAIPIVSGRAAVGSLGASGHSDANVTARVYTRAARG